MLVEVETHRAAQIEARLAEMHASSCKSNNNNNSDRCTAADRLADTRENVVEGEQWLVVESGAQRREERRRQRQRTRRQAFESSWKRKARSLSHLERVNWWLLLAAAALLSASLATLSIQAASTQQQAECTRNEHCSNTEKMCHENRCICPKDKPIEDKEGRCLSLAYMDDPCSINSQCFSDTECISGICKCGPTSISLFNPSTKLYYCHPKRQLNEECNFDVQCPQNAYCSTKNSGCLCSNGYLEASAKNENGEEENQCLAKICSVSSTCEEFHECVENKCLCLATHFDPHTGKCYRFGRTGGQQLEGEASESSTAVNSTAPTGGRVELNFQTLMEDLFKHGDNMWLVVLVLVVLSILIILLIFMALRRHYLGYCWTGGHKKEYEPNNKNPNQKDPFSKNSINNKSFRKKSELEAGDERVDDEHTSIIEQSKSHSKNGHPIIKGSFNGIKHQQKDYVRVSLNDECSIKNNQTEDPKGAYQQHRTLLPSSTSTPV